MSIQEKQKYLRQVILQSGINPNDFFEYWQEFNLELEDVEIDELKQVVNQFIIAHPVINHTEIARKQGNQLEQQQFSDFQDAEHKQTKHESTKQIKTDYTDFNWDFLSPKHQHANQPSKPQIQKKIVSEKEQQKSKVSKQDQKITNKNDSKSRAAASLLQQLNQSQRIEQNYKQQERQNVRQQKTLTVRQVLQGSKLTQINCLKLQENVLNHHPNVQISITKVTQVEDKTANFINKLIKNTYLQFTLKTVARHKNRTVGLSWQVNRKISDFQWLRSMLIKFYPGVVVPPLPSQPKSSIKLTGYLKKLQNFLIDCYRCPELRNSKYYQIFLSYSNHAQFQKFIKKSETVTKPKTLSHILNMSGVVQTLYSDNIQKYGIGLQKYLSTSSYHLKQVKQILAQINQLYSKISQSYKHLGSVFMQMAEQSHSFSDQTCYQRLANTYKQIAVLSGQHSTFCQNQKDLIDAFMTSHFSYQKDRLDNMQGLITKRTLFASQLAKTHKDQQGPGMFGKIASFFGDKSQYVDTPSSAYQTLYAQCGYYNNQLLRQSVRSIDVMIQSHVQHFSGYGMTRIDNVDKMQQTWSHILVQLSKLNLAKIG